MPTSPALALQSAILATLRADAPLTALLGGPRVFDAVPPRTAHPYIAYGPVTLRDWTAGQGPGHDHRVTVTAFSREPGFAQVYAIAGAIAHALDRDLPLDGHRLVLIRLDTAEVRRDPGGEISRAAVTLRALTEQL